MAGGGPGSASPVGQLLDRANNLEKLESADVHYPTWMENYHADLLIGTDPLGSTITYTPGSIMNVSGQIEAAKDQSPFNVAPYDPTKRMRQLEGRLDELADAIEDYDPEDYASTQASTARKISEGDFYPESRVDALVDAFEERQALRFARAATRINGALQDGQAIMSTQYGMAMAQLELDRAMEVNAFDAQARLQRERDLQDFTRSVIGVLQDGKVQQIQMLGQLMQAQQDFARLDVIAQQDAIDKQLEYQTRHLLWNLELFQYGGNLLASIAGANLVPRAQTRGERLISSFTSSAAFAIQVGTALKNPGAGAVAGGLLFAADALLGLK